jgi:hypothetical protein
MLKRLADAAKSLKSVTYLQEPPAWMNVAPPANAHASPLGDIMMRIL